MANITSSHRQAEARGKRRGARDGSNEQRERLGLAYPSLSTCPPRVESVNATRKSPVPEKQRTWKAMELSSLPWQFKPGSGVFVQSPKGRHGDASGVAPRGISAFRRLHSQIIPRMRRNPRSSHPCIRSNQWLLTGHDRQRSSWPFSPASKSSAHPEPQKSGCVSPVLLQRNLSSTSWPGESIAMGSSKYPMISEP